MNFSVEPADFLGEMAENHVRGNDLKKLLPLFCNSLLLPDGFFSSGLSLTSVLALAALFASLLSPAATADAASYRYRQSTGEKTQEFVWTLTQEREIRLTSVGNRDRYVTFMETDFATRQWSLRNPGAATAVTVRRDKDVLRMTGEFKGKPVNETVAIDDAPWYQALSLSLRELLDTKRRSLEFWTLRPDTLELYKLRAVRKGVETLQIAGKPVAALRLEVRLVGLKSLFWHCSYWLRQSDGVFLRYRGPSGPPGWPETEVRLIGREASAPPNLLPSSARESLADRRGSP